MRTAEVTWPFAKKEPRTPAQFVTALRGMPPFCCLHCVVVHCLSVNVHRIGCSCTGQRTELPAEALLLEIAHSVIKDSVTFRT